MFFLPFPPLSLFLSKKLHNFACHPENIEWIMEDQAFLCSYESAPRPPPPPSLPSATCFSYSVYLCARSSLLAGGGMGWARSQTRRPRDSLPLDKSFNTLWCHLSALRSGDASLLFFVLILEYKCLRVVPGLLLVLAGGWGGGRLTSGVS